MSGKTLENRHAIVTGGGHGIGAAIADALAGAGAHLTLLGRDRTRLVRTAAALAERHGIRTHPDVCDVTDAEGVKKAFENAARALGVPYILVNNAGIAEGAAFTETTRELWDRTLAVDLTGVFLCTQSVLPAMLAASAGRVVNIASTAGLKGYNRIAAYCAAKHGVIGLTRALAVETARHGITVNAVCPAYTEGDMSERAVAAIARARSVAEDEARQRMERLIPIGRLIRPEEVAGSVLWLCSPEAAAVTGQSIAVAGGEVM